MYGKEDFEESIWRNGFLFALILLVVLGSCLIWIGASKYPPGSFLHIFLVGIGISMAPASLIGILFRVFLFKEVKYELTNPVLNEIREKLLPEIQLKVDEIIKRYHSEIQVLNSVQDAGVIRVFKQRKEALDYSYKATHNDRSEIMIVGSSLKGLLQMDEHVQARKELRRKIEEDGVRVKIMLTHPVVADFRVCQENRNFTAIGEEIIKSLEVLKEWGVPSEHVRLFKGTPTCFGIKAERYMLLDTYPYCAVAYYSPCFIIETSATNPSYVYDMFSKTHFNAWDTTLSERILDYDDTIKNFQKELKHYAKKVSEVLDVRIR